MAHKKTSAFTAFLKKRLGIRDMSAERAKKEQRRKEILVVDSLEELPKDLMKKVKKADISLSEAEENLDILLNVIHFSTKARFKCMEDQKQKERDLARKEREKRREENADRKEYDLMEKEIPVEDLVEEGDPRKKFKIGRMEGSGGFGRVYRALARDGHKKSCPKEGLALKIMTHKTEKEMRLNVSELAFLKACNHANIVQFHSCYLVENDLWLFMEFLEGGILTDAARVYKFEDEHIAYVAREILMALAYLHHGNLIHRDVKSSNVMMSCNGDIKLIDFGLCCSATEGVKITMVGSPFWIAPEMIRREIHGKGIDIWALGVVLLELANGHPPCYKSSVKAMFNCGVYGLPHPLEKPTKWTEQFIKFISLCLEFDPDERFSAKKLLREDFLKRAVDTEVMKKILTGIFVLQSVLPF